MRKYLLLVLLVSIGFGQDVLILKMGARYEGEFLGEKSNKVHFKANNFSNIFKTSIKYIKELNQNGKLLIENGEWLVDSQDYLLKLSTNLGASSKEHFKERGISKLKTTNKNFGSGSIIKANDNQIRFVTKPNSLQQMLYRGLLVSYSEKEYLIDIKSIEEITHDTGKLGKLLRTISNLSIPGTYCFTFLVNIWSDPAAAHIEALIMTMIPVAVRGLLKYPQDKMNTIRMSNWDETKKKVYLEKLFSK